MLRRTGSAVGLGMTDGVQLPAEAGRATPRPWAATGSITIDALLVWAIRDQGAHRQRAGLLEQEAAADAALRGRSAGFHWYRASSDGVAAVERIGMMNCRIDVSRSSGGERVSEVAEAVFLAAAASAEAESLIMWADLGMAPGGWRVPERMARPRLGWAVDGVEGVTVYEGQRRTGRATPVVIMSRDGVGAARRQYQLWWDALEQVAWEVGLLALGFVVTAPSVERAPWETERLDVAAIG